MVSDFSVFHRIDDIEALPSVKFFKLASRIFAYDGCMTARAHEESEYDEDGHKKTDRTAVAVPGTELRYTAPEPFEITYE